MAKPGRQSFEKRLREKKRKEKRQEKADRKEQRKADKESGIVTDDDVDWELSTTVPDDQKPVKPEDTEATDSTAAADETQPDSAPTAES